MKGFGDKPLNLNEARQIYTAMRGQAPNQALDRTQVQLNGSNLSSMYSRMAANPRLTSTFRKAVGKMKVPPALLKAKFPDAYAFEPDMVLNPSGQPGVLMHELGHAIDFNSNPHNTMMQKFRGQMYRQFAPHVWKERAAWNKGRQAFMQGAAQNNLSPELVTRVLNNSEKTRPIGMGSYYGGTAGKIVGTGVGGGIGYSMGKFPVEKVLTGVMGGTLGNAAGQAIGAGTGIMLGRAVARARAQNMPALTDRHLAEYAKMRAQMAPKPALSVA